MSYGNKFVICFFIAIVFFISLYVVSQYPPIVAETFCKNTFGVEYYSEFIRWSNYNFLCVKTFQTYKIIDGEKMYGTYHVSEGTFGVRKSFSGYIDGEFVELVFPTPKIIYMTDWGEEIYIHNKIDYEKAYDKIGVAGD